MIGIIGSGISGLTAAISLARNDEDVIVFTLDKKESNSYLAQAGIALPLRNGDSYLSHVIDTLKSSKGLSNYEVVWNIITKSSDALDFLLSIGVEFTSYEKEGGHSFPRVFSIKGSTGKYIIEKMMKYAEELGVKIVKKEVTGLAIKNGKCYGVLTNEDFIPLKAVILATGGYSALYKYFSGKPENIGLLSGDALLKGAYASNLELIQFHPTAYVSEKGVILISEAVRGAGGKIIDSQGKRFVNELDTRDIVSRAIYEKLLSGEKVYLDAREIKDFDSRFPEIYEKLVSAGVDPKEDPIPITPVAHYSIGGLKVDIFYRSNIEKLYVIGEAADNGFHGANRLASNSLLECIVGGLEVARTIRREKPDNEYVKKEEFRSYKKNLNDLNTLREAMWRFCGIVRAERLLVQGINIIKSLDLDIRLKTLALGILKSALERRESRGVHYRSDYPKLNPNLSKRSIFDGINVTFESSEVYL